MTNLWTSRTYIARIKDLQKIIKVSDFMLEKPIHNGTVSNLNINQGSTQTYIPILFKGIDHC